MWHFMQIVCIGDTLETICMKCEILFSGKKKKDISKCRLLKILSIVLSINIFYTCLIQNQNLFEQNLFVPTSQNETRAIVKFSL